MQQNVEDTSSAVCVVGLGYVGLPLALTLADIGYHVTGIDCNADKVHEIMKGISPLGSEPGVQDLLARMLETHRFAAEPGWWDICISDVVFICVETPVDPDTHQPGYRSLKDALWQVMTRVKEGALIIIESTLAPGTMQEIVRPFWHASDNHSYLAHCPERIQPGKILETLRTRPRVVGGMSPECAQRAATIYRKITSGDVDETDCVTAELVKTAENAYRDVQIAFANSLALICEDHGANVWRVRDLVNKCPYRDVHEPGAGVGGHCIAKDPWLLISRATNARARALIVAARQVNAHMPYHVFGLLAEALEEAHVPLESARVVVLGYSYLPGSSDTRNAPSEVLVELLKERVLEVRVHDPYVAQYQGRLASAIYGMDACIIMTAHPGYANLGLPILKQSLRHPIVIDGRRVIDPEQARQAGLTYKGVGIG